MLPTTVRVDKSDSLPRHSQVRQILLEMIASEIWRPGDKIPAETEIARALEVSKMTVNKAILALTAEGVFYREVGRGTFISNPLPLSGREALHRERAEGVQMIQAITTNPLEWVPNNEYLCELLLAMRCCVSPLEVELGLRHARGPDYLAAWREGKADGWLLIAPLEADVAGLRALEKAEAHAVIVGASWEGVGLPCVDSDNVVGARQAVEHLIGLGHREIGLLYTKPESINTQDRVRGFRAAMEAHGLPLRDDWLLEVEGDWGIPEAMQVRLRERLRLPDRPSALFAAGPYLARALLDVAQEIGIDVPDALSIVGFDDLPAVAEASPAITTIRQPLEEMAQEGMRLLRQRIAQSEPLFAERRMLPCRLLARESSAPPPTKE